MRTVATVFDYVLADTARNKRSFSIGIVTVFLVVSFIRWAFPRIIDTSS